ISQAKPEADLTMQGYQSFTPQYASPEQVLGNPITTASDTYSLGVLLYQLLTGVLPYELKELSTAELVRVICEEPPRKAKAQIEGVRLDADLEAMLAKALRKEPEERYRTAERMAADISAYLVGLPVAARKGSFRYRAGKFVRRNRWTIVGVGLIALVLAAGVVGILWQARIATQERKKAEARSEDLRQLSNSLLSELAEAIKQLPGSTGVQQLLVTRVLEHLDRMAHDAEGDRQTQLDLVDAYARLGNIQGNAYDQNLGDPKGALASLDKALAIAKPLVARDAKDAGTLRSLAFVEQSRSEVLYQMGDTEKAVAAMKEAVSSFSTLIANPRVTPELLGEAASAFGSLGDQLGAPGTPSLGDREGAIEWYRRTIDVDNRALGIDPHYLRSLRGLAIMQIKLGTVEVETDPEQALRDFQLGDERVKALPESQQTSMLVTRIRYMLMRKEANTYAELEEYAKAYPLFEAVRAAQEKVLAADPKDSRAQADVEIDLNDEATTYENEGNSDPQKVKGAKKRKCLEAARELMQRALGMMDQMLAQDAMNTNWQANAAMITVHIGILNAELRDRPVDVGAVTKAITVLRKIASEANASPAALSQAAEVFVEVKPEQLRDARFSLACAQREAAISSGKAGQGETPARLLAEAMAYSAMGDRAGAHAAAQKGLEMMVPPGQGRPPSRLYRELLLTSQGKDLSFMQGGPER
ncbi:MAG TPA: protein kinase, partial [Acidobacteriaceae bacterium]